MKTWVYIFEDGQFGISKTGPTPTDLELVSDGTLTILHSASTIVQINDDNRPEAILTCEIKKVNKETWHQLPEEE